jgi:hypothetical protein
MNSLINKLQFKNHKKILILNSPKEFDSFKLEISKQSDLHERIDSKSKYDFLVVFVKNCSDIKTENLNIINLLEEDAVFWYAYPKKTSKKYTSDITRDNGWQPLGVAGFEAVRQVAIDEDWSALRFRKTEFIKSFKRDKGRAMSEAGKKRKS